MYIHYIHYIHTQILSDQSKISWAQSFPGARSPAKATGLVIPGRSWGKCHLPADDPLIYGPSNAEKKVEKKC